MLSSLCQGVVVPFIGTMSYSHCSNTHHILSPYTMVYSCCSLKPYALQPLRHITIIIPCYMKVLLSFALSL